MVDSASRDFAFTLLRHARVFTPDDAGVADILFAGRTVVAIAPSVDVSSLPGQVRVHDVAGSLAVPGLVDGHIHLIGGGGNEGFELSSDRISPSDMLRLSKRTFKRSSTIFSGVQRRSQRLMSCPTSHDPSQCA